MIDVFELKTKYLEYVLEEWNHSPISWQQNNRNILNEAIRLYNSFLYGKCELEKVVDEIVYAENKLKNECGNYQEDIDFMKHNINMIINEENKEEE